MSETATPTASAAKKQPVVILVVGMAGTGKTTLVHRIQHYTASQGISSYYINLDPAVSQLPYNANIDIRDTVNYHEVMRSYRLGPNGAILTSLNLFATKFYQVVSLLERKESLDWVVVDTPGQIEVFSWSASGQLVAESLAAAFPTVILFVADTTRCVSPQAFISTMLYASGMMLKQQVPLVVVLNKTDVVSADTAIAWMRDDDKLEEAIAAADSGEDGGGAGASDYLDRISSSAGYSSTLARSMALYLHEFYEDLPSTGVSAATGAGMEQLEEAVIRAKQQAAAEAQRRQGREDITAGRQVRQAEAFHRDVADEKAM